MRVGVEERTMAYKDGSGAAARSNGAGGLVYEPNDRNLFAESGSGAGYIGEGGCGKSGNSCIKIPCAKGGESSAKKLNGQWAARVALAVVELVIKGGCHEGDAYVSFTFEE